MMGLASRMFCLCTTKFKSQFNFKIGFAFYLVIVANDDLYCGDF